MRQPDILDSSSGAGQRAEDRAALLFKANGWKVQREPLAGPHRADLLVKRGRETYVVEVKAPSEARPDRVIPLLSQAILQAQTYAREIGKVRPLAIIYVREASASLLKQVEAFAISFAPEVAVGVISESGVQRFWGRGLEQLSVEPAAVRKHSAKSPGPVSHIFSDLNQWMLKVLLAPEIPERLLSAPRGEYRNASELASGANVSVMSAFRYVQQLRDEGFLEESSPRLRLVRRAELFRRWRAEALRISPEVPMSFLIRRSAQVQVREIVSKHGGCLGLFAAAEALKLGHVRGVPPYVYVPGNLRLGRVSWKELMPADTGGPVDLILKQPRAPRSVFRGAVHADEVAVSDVLQIWLDVSAHPSRGEEQAELIYQKVLKKIVGGDA